MNKQEVEQKIKEIIESDPTYKGAKIDITFKDKRKTKCKNNHYNSNTKG